MIRIYTEDVNRDAIEQMLAAWVTGYTLIPANGYYKGAKERSLIIELANVDRDTAMRIATVIKVSNSQDSVLVVETPSINMFV